MTNGAETKDTANEARPPSNDLWDIVKQWIALPLVLLLAWFTDGIKTLFNRPGHALWVLIPFGVLSGLILNPGTRKYFKDVPWRYLVFLAVYILSFFLIAQTGVLDWPRPLVGYDSYIPRNFLALDRLGDWVYKIAPEEGNSDLVVVVKKHPNSIQERRLQLADLIELATESNAKGIALDFYFVDEEEGIDEYLCETIKAATIEDGTKPMPILVGYDFEIANNAINRLPGNPILDNCLPESNRGHAIGYKEFDGVIRSIPIYREKNDKYHSLSLKIAAQLAAPNKTVALPENYLVEFVKPKKDFAPLKFETLWQNYKENPAEWEKDQNSLRDRFILVGEESEHDRFSTPYGDKAGVVIHAYAAHSLNQGHFIKRAKWWISLAMIFVASYLLVIIERRPFGTVKNLVLVTAGFSIIMVLCAGLAMPLFLNRIELVYPLVALWLFLLLFFIFRGIAGRPTREPEFAKSTA